MTNKLQPLAPALQSFIVEDDDEDIARFQDKRGAKPKGEKALTKKEQKRNYKAKKKESRIRNIAVLDMETDPFDNTSDAKIFPFVAMLYSDEFEPVTIWDENPDSFVARVVQTINDLPESFTIYAHNGGRFDFMFLLKKLRGSIAFKGLGIMSAKIGAHELRDSFHIIPERLAAFAKDTFDYAILTKEKRNKKGNPERILAYLESDCRYLLQIVKAFVADHGLKLSIGQAAMAALQAQGYGVEKMTEGTDAFMRHYFFGGRVECLAGKGVFTGAYKLIDVNSMYPYAMAHYKHPTGNQVFPRQGDPTENTFFIDLECDNYGAFVARGEDGETSAHIKRGRFRVSIYEYRVALKYNLIENVKINWCLDFFTSSDFSEFVVPLYEKRQLTKQALKRMKKEGVSESSREYLDTKKDDLFYKLLLNNAYGKFAQNPRDFKECLITDFGDSPEPHGVKPEDMDEWVKSWGPLPYIENEAMGYAIWQRPQKRLTFNNVATAASITGAARSVLLEAICNATDPVYCDTDSLICRDVRDTELHPDKLGAWDIEDEYSEVVIAGKKLYGCLKTNGAHKIRSKGAPLNQPRGRETQTEADARAYNELKLILKSEIMEHVTVTSRGVTMTKSGQQFYMRRNIRATAKPANPHLHYKLQQRGLK